MGEPGEIIGVPAAGGQVHVNRRGRLGKRVVVLLMERDGEDVFARSLANISTGVDGAQFGSRPGGQSRSLVAGVAKDNGSAVALMHVAIDRHGALDELALLQAADGDSEVVQHTEAFAVIGVGVVKAAANADADSVSHGALSGKERPRGG